MDVLSRILSTLRLHAPLFSIIEMSGDVSLKTPAVPGVTAFHFVSKGECRICEGDQEHLLAKGDFGIFPHWPDFRIETGRKVAPVNFLDLKAEQGQPSWSTQHGPESPIVIHVGSPPFTTQILTGMFLLDTAEAKLLPGGHSLAIRFGPEDTPLQDWALACLNFVIRESAEPRAGFAAMAEQTLQLLLTHALRDWWLRHKLTGWVRGLADPRIHRALQVIHEQPSRSWTIEELAKIAGQSRAGFAALFVDIMSETPIVYLTRWRMHLAAMRLKKSVEPISNIAENVGYKSIFAFSRSFRTHYKMTPGVYRRTTQYVRLPSSQGSLEDASTG